jgi:hypothetical protein
MLLLFTTHLIALVIGGGHKGGQDSSHNDWAMTYTPTPGQPRVETVCAANHCLGTKTNPIPRAQQWLSMGESSSSGCCSMWHGACARCVQPYTCYEYGTGQNDEWCQKASQVPGSPIAWTDNVADRPVRYLGCGWCACCQRTDPKTGLPAIPAGLTAQGSLKDIGDLMPGQKKKEEAALGDWIDDAQDYVDEARDGVNDAQDAINKARDAERLFDVNKVTTGYANAAVVEPHSLNAFEISVYGFAAFGFAVVVFGAYKHYSKKGQLYPEL